MRSIESTGRSIDEAIFHGLQQLEISIDGVEIEILQQESKGILGIGARPAKVRLTEREPEEVVMPDYLKEQPRPNRDRPRRERSDRPRRERGDRNEREARMEREAQLERENRGERPLRRERERKPERPEKPAIPYSLEAAQDNPGAIFLQGLIQHMGVEGQVLAYVEEEGIRLCVDTPTMGVLIGHRGETLDAMQYLTSLAVNRNRKEEGYTRVTLDTEGYREKREETLARLARKIAGQVKASGRPRELEPMNPYERRVLHASLQNNPYVVTHSEGEEPNRRVVISPKPREARKEQRPSKEKQQRLVEEVETVEIIRPAGDASDPTQEQE
ncbi:MAG: RNA-binding cell elongation regulator Jag/EloR [Christensenellales bacterium]|nr:RNA-binding cell elongation regulator Jag/EloR [Christensenellales bacterium]